MIDGYSTFGFETEGYNSGLYWRRVGKAYEGSISITDDTFLDRVQLLWRKENTKKLAGYIPVYGIWVGGNRIWDVVHLNPSPDNKVSLIARGIIEILGLGLLLALLDVPIWAYRKCRQMPPAN